MKAYSTIDFARAELCNSQHQFDDLTAGTSTAGDFVAAIVVLRTSV